MTMVDVATRAPKGEMRIMDPSGDTRMTWDATDEADVAAAEAAFDTLRHKGFQAFRVDDKGNDGELIREFDPTAEAIVMVPAMAGG